MLELVRNCLGREKTCAGAGFLGFPARKETRLKTNLVIATREDVYRKHALAQRRD
jgi:hypothetical protein